jgi:hypothetical protein
MNDETYCSFLIPSMRFGTYHGYRYDQETIEYLLDNSKFPIPLVRNNEKIGYVITILPAHDRLWVFGRVLWHYHEIVDFASTVVPGIIWGDSKPQRFLHFIPSNEPMVICNEENNSRDSDKG